MDQSYSDNRSDTIVMSIGPLDILPCSIRRSDDFGILCTYIEVSHFESCWQDPYSSKLKYEHLIICKLIFYEITSEKVPNWRNSPQGIFESICVGRPHIYILQFKNTYNYIVEKYFVWCVAT